ncbi:hypothetical protein NDU88_000423 [Pleurodeles waltl]|uniref:Uncharacterized protein n=1 Tax=Pleurodeles waltl TaxID=8319 RepID=A0AAV7N7X1_PLEWA|nr:hypothetical protein NDU88_000423 [Pleurodeles waltl]
MTSLPVSSSGSSSSRGGRILCLCGDPLRPGTEIFPLPGLCGVLQVPSSFQGRAVVSSSNAPRLNKKVLVRSWAVEVVTGTRPPHRADSWAQD